MRRILAVGIVLLVASATGAALAAPSQGLRLVPVVSGLSSPVLATQAPGEPANLYVVEQTGQVRVVRGGKVRSTFLDVGGAIVSGGEQGLLGLAFARDYARSHRFYVNYTARGTGATVVSRYRSAGGTAVPSSRTTLVRVAQPYPNHNGGNLVVGPDGRLWVGLGDGGSGGDPENRAQNPATLLGKMFTLDVRKAKPAPVLFAIGLRNPWRYSFDRATGDLWIGDVGQDSFEEVDVVRKGTTGLLNFGWDVYEGNHDYERKPLGPGTLVKPIAEYPHSDGCSITGGYVYRGKAVPSLRGRYVFGDYCSGSIWSLPASGGAVRKEPVSVEQLASFGESLSGELYVVSQKDGVVYRIAAG